MFWFIGKFKSREKTSLLGVNLLNSTKGFSLLELIVVIAIFLIITAVVIADIPNFREKSTLDLTVSEVATYIRGAQVYSSAQVGSNSVSSSYGINFDKNSSDFYLYNENSSDVQQEKYSLNGFLINNILLREGDIYNCDINKVKIKFKSNSYVQNIGTVLEASLELDDNGTTVEIFEYLDLQIKGVRNSNLIGCLRVYRNGQVTNISCSTEDSFTNCS